MARVLLMRPSVFPEGTMATHIRSSLVKPRSHATSAVAFVRVVPALQQVEVTPRPEPPPPSGTHVRKPPPPRPRPAMSVAFHAAPEPIELDVAPDPTEPPGPTPASLLDNELLMWSDLARVRRALLAKCVMGVVGACLLLCVVAVVQVGTREPDSPSIAREGARDGRSALTSKTPSP